MLFNPFEEKFNLPTAFVEVGNSFRVQGKIVGQKHKALFVFLVVIFRAS
jgi:hypothetical protein